MREFGDTINILLNKITIGTYVLLLNNLIMVYKIQDKSNREINDFNVILSFSSILKQNNIDVRSILKSLEASRNVFLNDI